MRQEDNIKKFKEVERLIQEAPQFKFNTNVFKSSVKLDMSDDERQKEEQLVEDLSKHIIEKAIPSLISDLKQMEGVPTDSSSLEDFFHKRGINMRYLGKVNELLDSILYFDKQTSTAVTKDSV